MGQRACVAIVHGGRGVRIGDSIAAPGRVRGDADCLKDKSDLWRGSLLPFGCAATAKAGTASPEASDRSSGSKLPRHKGGLPEKQNL
ncbi:hypothetical protein FHK92_26260 [Pseudomonas brassicacearum subsp. neoaurantiaca]|uniref:Uncharacterized protein n=1 Tax=Pseudomonas brassicacearum subsp. neoaurantiaca TaxID=494916 RepID=A0A7V8UGR9_9PSED|nr:hypothetical protein [Pseudomonas brassicacearum subsp. neoaurantiaca]